ncbi:ROK family transcriptional regulator [Mucilaginibacter ginkgonis]|uniref:ROK family protein n=1 Tax=Mucilaginibacter ginkgonis TaxID=2682091 RepID=A0A6I4I2N8_9SPHI|nr:ROK family protein [Mucilaginibacter ginkgonis]QQL49551.1 ROK family protein [Mucilaginibacter ginkgonis]
MEAKAKAKKQDGLTDKVLKQFYFNHELSCADISARLNKSIPLITKSINELTAGGLVIEQGLAQSSGGRRPLLYSIKPDAIYVLAVAMDQLSLRIGLLDMHNKPVADVQQVELTLFKNTKSLQRLIEIINEYIKSSGVAKSKIAGIGIGMPGFVNIKEGINYSYLDAEGEDLKEVIGQATGLPVVIDNDSSLVALAEQRFGAAKDQKEVMVINLGWGIGLGMIINGKLFRGHDGFAGELSHIPLSENGELCNCGKRGCLEVEASMLAVAQKAIAGIKEGKITSLKHITDDPHKLAGDAIMDAANSGDHFAIDLLAEAGYKIGKALAILAHIMNPETIVLSGRGARVGKILQAPIQQAMNKYCIPRLVSNTSLKISEIGFDAELIGAAVLVMDNFKLNK